MVEVVEVVGDVSGELVSTGNFASEVLGGSSGINIAGAIKLAKKMGPGNTIVTILCDHGKRYASKIFNKDFLKSKNLPVHVRVLSRRKSYVLILIK